MSSPSHPSAPRGPSSRPPADEAARSDEAPSTPAATPYSVSERLQLEVDILRDGRPAQPADREHDD